MWWQGCAWLLATPGLLHVSFVHVTMQYYKRLRSMACIILLSLRILYAALHFLYPPSLYSSLKCIPTALSAFTYSEAFVCKQTSPSMYNSSGFVQADVLLAPKWTCALPQCKETCMLMGFYNSLKWVSIFHWTPKDGIYWSHLEQRKYLWVMVEYLKLLWFLMWSICLIGLDLKATCTSLVQALRRWNEVFVVTTSHSAPAI